MHAINRPCFQGEKYGKPKVGTSDLPLHRRVQLAVLAHIRHTHTRYDELLKEADWHTARKTVERICLDILVKWRGDEETGRDQLNDILREVVVISDDSDDSDDFDSRKNARQKAAGENQTYEEALARNPLVLIRKLVRGIRSSGQRRDAFRDVIREGIQNRSFIDPQNGKAVTSLPEHELLRDVATRWDSTHSMITRAQELRLVC